LKHYVTAGFSPAVESSILLGGRISARAAGRRPLRQPGRPTLQFVAGAAALSSYDPANLKPLVILMGLACALLSLPAEPALHVPSGFNIRPVAGPPEVGFPMFATLDDQRRLYVTESSGNDLYVELND